MGSKRWITFAERSMKKALKKDLPSSKRSELSASLESVYENCKIIIFKVGQY